MRKRTKLPPIEKTVQSTPTRAPTPERYKLCPECGQSYDIQHMGETFHHTSGPHEALPPEA